MPNLFPSTVEHVSGAVRCSTRSLIRQSTARPHRLPRPVTSAHRTISSTTPRNATPLYMLSALSHARETQHFAKLSGLGVTNHVPNLEAIKRGEVDPFEDKKPVQKKIVASIADPGPVRSVETPQAISAGRSLRAGSVVEPSPVVVGAVPTATSVPDRQSVNVDASNTQLALVALVVALVAMNAYFFEQLAGERTEREKLIGRIQRLEQGGRSASSRRAARREERRRSREQRGTSGVPTLQEAGAAPDVVLPRQGVRGFFRSLIWAS